MRLHVFPELAADDYRDERRADTEPIRNLTVEHRSGIVVPQLYRIYGENGGMTTRATGHTGGFIAAYADGPKVIEVGFLNETGELVVVSREAFDRAAEWINQKESTEQDAINLADRGLNGAELTRALLGKPHAGG